jgi:hypothetical protein
MPDRKLMELCRRIATEPNPAKLAVAIDELIKLLAEEQDTIKAKIRANLRNHMGTVD